MLLETDKRLIVLAKEDTVAVVRCAIEAGSTVLLLGQSVTLSQAVHLGHKLALKSMQPGDKVRKYNASIGSATAVIAVGDHVHLHNMRSAYTPTYSLKEQCI